MKDKIISSLKSQRNTMIALIELQNIFSGYTDYECFAKQIKILEEEKILTGVKQHKTNNRPISLYNTYRINKSHFKDMLVDEIQEYKLKFNENINLNLYFKLNEKEWRKDLKYIKLVDSYIKKNGLPSKESSAQEISYKIVGNEKWIEERGGKTLLNRIDVWDKLKISHNVDPLMLAINPQNIKKSTNTHLIVENKATFYDFLYSLDKASYTSIVYGAGWRIISNISMLEKQLGLTDRENIYHYFGDLDYEGISIWNRLNEEIDTCLAIEFYKGFLKKKAQKGKGNQKKNIKALENFKNYFNKEENKKIEEILNDGCYYPQESLSKFEIEDIWRKQDEGNN